MPSSRILPRFEFYAPENLEQAVAFLAKNQPDARVIAGGTDILIQMKLHRVKAKFLVGIAGVPELSGIRFDSQAGLTLGAAAILRDIGRSSVVARNYPILVEAIRQMGSIQVNSMATIGGNICNASPAADTVPALIVHDAKLRVTNPSEERVVAIEDFFLGPGKTVLSPSDVLVAIHLPVPPQGLATAFGRIARTGQDIAKVNVAVAVLVKDGLCADARIALGAVAPTPIRAWRAEAFLRGKPIRGGVFEEAAEIACGEAKPITDLRSTAEYRRRMTKILVQRALQEAEARLPKQ